MLVGCKVEDVHSHKYLSTASLCSYFSTRLRHMLEPYSSVCRFSFIRPFLIDSLIFFLPDVAGYTTSSRTDSVARGLEHGRIAADPGNATEPFDIRP